MAKKAALLTFAVNKKATPSPDAPDSREGVKVKGFRMGLEDIRQFEILRAELGRTGQDLIAEALQDLFIKHGKRPTA